MHANDIETALSAYEEALFPRSQSIAVEAHQTLDLFLGARAPFGLIDLLTGADESDRGPISPSDLDGQRTVGPFPESPVQR